MFNGFTPAAIDFLWGIRFNNNRDWFQEHKAEYQRDLYQPMLALADAVREKFQIEGTVLKTSRIYRDVRYSGGIPYKEHLWFCIRQDNVFWSEHPSMYFQIEPGGWQLWIYPLCPQGGADEPPSEKAAGETGSVPFHCGAAGEGRTIYGSVHPV